jgi:hypothetical protein
MFWDSGEIQQPHLGWCMSPDAQSGDWHYLLLSVVADCPLQDWSVQSHVEGVHKLLMVPPFCVSAILCIHKAKISQPPTINFKLYQIEFLTGALVLLAKSGVGGIHSVASSALGDNFSLPNDPKASQPCSCHLFWIPASILEHALPEMVNDFHKSHKSTVPNRPTLSPPVSIHFKHETSFID